MRIAATLIVLCCLAGPVLAESDAPAKDLPDELCVRGHVAEGPECAALRTADGTVYSLARGTPTVAKDREVCVCGKKAEMSVCQQGVTLTAVRLGKPGDCR